MSDILQIADFEEGIYTIPLAANQEAILQEYLNDIECEYLPRLFGVDLSDLFIADLVGGVPQTQRFIDVFDKFQVQPEDCFIGDEIYQSLGIKELLKRIVYFFYIRGSFVRLTNNGPKITVSENSENPNPLFNEMFTRWNEAVDYWIAIQYRMSTEDPNTYPEYKGVREQYAIRY